MKSALAIQCLPLGVAEKDALYALVDRAIRAIDASALTYTVGPFETVIEGPIDELWEVAKMAHQAIANVGLGGVATYMKMFTAPDLGDTDEKVSKYRQSGH